MPINNIKTGLDKNYFLVGECDNESWLVLRVPNRFLYDNLPKFDTNYDNVIRLHLASYPENWLVDERVKENQVKFCSFEL